MVKKSMKTYVTLAVVIVVCISFPYAAFAAVGAEPSNQSADNTYTAAPAVANIPPYPGMDSSGAFIASVQPGMQSYPDIPSYPYQQGTVPASYGNVPGMMYSPYGTMPNMYYPGSGDMTGMMYSPYGTMPNMYGDMTGNIPYGNIYQVPSTGMMPGGMYPVPPTGGEASQYPMPYTMYPYDPYQQYGQMYPQQGYYSPYSYGTADQTYNQAKQAFDSKDYWTAMTKFQEVASRFPQSDLVDNAYYWMGEVYYAWKNFPAAIQSFQTVLYSYPQGNKVPDAHVKMGFAYAEMRQYSMAKSILNDVASRYQGNARIRGLALKKLNELNNQY